MCVNQSCPLDKQITDSTIQHRSQSIKFIRRSPEQLQSFIQTSSIILQWRQHTQMSVNLLQISFVVYNFLLFLLSAYKTIIHSTKHDNSVKIFIWKLSYQWQFHTNHTWLAVQVSTRPDWVFYSEQTKSFFKWSFVLECMYDETKRWTKTVTVKIVLSKRVTKQWQNDDKGWRRMTKTVTSDYCTVTQQCHQSKIR